MQRLVLLVLTGLLLGALLTGLAGALPGSQDLTALSWLGTVSTVAALVVAVGIYRVQQTQSDAAHQELLDALKAQDEVLQDLTDSAPASDAPAPTPEPVPVPAEPNDGLTPEQREAITARYGDSPIFRSWDRKPGRVDGPRLVEFDDGRLVMVYRGGRREGQGGGLVVREVGSGRQRGRSPRGAGPSSRSIR